MALNFRIFKSIKEKEKWKMFFRKFDKINTIILNNYLYSKKIYVIIINFIWIHFVTWIVFDNNSNIIYIIYFNIIIFSKRVLENYKKISSWRSKIVSIHNYIIIILYFFIFKIYNCFKISIIQKIILKNMKNIFINS